MNESNFQQNTGKPNDEIDIFEFCARMWNAFAKFLSGLKSLIVSFIILLIRKSLWIISFAIIGILLGFGYTLFRKPYYVSLLEGTSGGVDNTVVIDHVNKLDMMVKKPEVLARHLGLNIEEAEQVYYIRAFYGIDINRDGIPDLIDERNTYNPRDTMQRRVPSVFYVKVALFDEDILPKLRESLLRYINNNVYIQTLYDIDIRQKREMIAELDKEIAKLDTIHLITVNQRANIELQNRVFVMGSEPELRVFYTDILSLFAQKQELRKSMEISDSPVVIVQDFTPSLYEERTSIYYIFWLGLAMAFVGFVCAILWQYRVTLWKLIVEEQK